MNIRTGYHLIVALALMAIGGCAIFSPRTWRDVYSGSPLTFVAPADSADTVWQRARAWFGGTTRPILDVGNDTLLQSARTKSSGSSYVISMTRRPAGESEMFVVTFSIPEDAFSGPAEDRARDRAEELAYMAATADSPQAHLQRISRKEADPIYDWRHP